jgi:hypothetical protein
MGTGVLPEFPFSLFAIPVFRRWPALAAVDLDGFEALH